MKSLIITLFSILSVLSISAQEKVQVSGNVITTDGKPAEFVTVLLKNTGFGGTTDADGRFRFTAREGKYTLVVQSIFTHKEEFKVTLVAGKENVFKDIKTKENSTQLDQVVVTGQFAPQSMRKSLYKVKTINSEAIKMKAPASVEALLNTEAGIRISNDMALGESDFELMGMGGNNVKVLLDGVALLDRSEKKQSLSQIDVNSIERIEIVEGPMSVIYGTDALAGVINIITKKGKGLSKDHSWYVNARVHEESVGKEYDFFKDEGIHNESVDLGMTLNNGFYFNGSASRNNSGGWQGDMDGRAKQWHPKDQTLLSGMLGYRRHNMNVWYRLNYTDEAIYSPFNANGNMPELISDVDYLTDRYNHQVQADWNPNNKFMMNFVFSYQDYKRRTRSVFTHLGTGDRWFSPEAGSQDVTKYNSWNARLTGTWNICPKFSLQPGLEYQRTEGSGDRIKGTNSVEDVALFLSGEYKPTDWLSLRPGVRTFLSTSYDAPFAVPSLLTKFDLNEKMDLRMSYAYGFRTPTVKELYMDFFKPEHAHVLGNPDLKAEYSNNITASYTYRIIHRSDLRLTASLGGFYNIFKDKIDYLVDANDAMLAKYANINQYKTVGGTFETNLTWKNLNANVNFALVGRKSNFDEEKAMQSDYCLSPELGVNLMYTIPRIGTSVSMFYKFTGARDSYFTEENNGKEILLTRTTPSYNYADITLSQKIASFVNVNIGVKNLFNLTSLQTKSNKTEGNNPTLYMGCGRSWFVGLNFNLDGKF